MPVKSNVMKSTKPKQTRRSLPMALLRAREAVMEQFRPMLSRHDVTEQQWRVIRVVAEAGKLDASEVAARASILAPSLTRMIRSLEARRFIKRRKDAGDGRRVILEIAPAGLALIERASPESLSVYNRLEARFGKQNLEALLDLLDDLTAKPLD
jgi:homoprotocatechuate degradation regulator HpaR